MLFPWFTYTVAVFRLYFFQNSSCSRAGHVVSFAFSSIYDPRFPLRVLRHGWLMGMLAHFRNLWTSGLDNLQSWTKVLGTVLRDSYFSVICRFPLKTVHPFRNFLALLPPPTLYKVETRKTFWIHLVRSPITLTSSNIVCGVRGGVGPVWIGKRPREEKVSQDFCPWL